MGKKLAVAVGISVIAVSGLLFAEGNHKYVGVKKCAMCHKSESRGNQYGQWVSTKHSKAYEDLASPAGLETAKKAGVTGNPQEAPQCLKCHVTGYGQDAGLFAEGFVKADGVQCESCHGAGSDYLPILVMKDKAKAIDAGLIIPIKEGCVKCHNSESPNFTGFDFDSYYKKIVHPEPEKQ